MFLTHIDEEGNDSPAILIENATAANRAVNLPEFANIPEDGLLQIDVPAAEFYKLFDRAWNLGARGENDAAIAEWRKALLISPHDAKAHNNLGTGLFRAENWDQAIAEWQKAVEIRPGFVQARYNLGRALARKGKLDLAIEQWQKTTETDHGFAEAHFSLGEALCSQARTDDALSHWKTALTIAIRQNQPSLAETVKARLTHCPSCPCR